jgi:hypothetical protein
MHLGLLSGWATTLSAEFGVLQTAAAWDEERQSRRPS